MRATSAVSSSVHSTFMTKATASEHHFIQKFGVSAVPVLCYEYFVQMSNQQV